MGSSRPTYRIAAGDGRSTEQLVEDGRYGYAHSCVTSENFPVRAAGAACFREILLLEFDHDVPSEEAITEALRLGLQRPTYEDALYFGAAYPDAQRERPIVFLHDPWFGFFGRRDVLCLWTNAGRRELGLEGFDETWNPDHRFAFVRPPDESSRELTMMRATDLATVREFYAEELRAVANVRSPGLIRAFATVPREHFLGPGPWQILAPTHPGDVAYRTTEDADPRHLYHDVLVAIDTARRLHNGQPSALALWMDALDLQTGERVVHIGCGLGYYTAILAAVVGPAGHVTAIELDADLAARSRHNLCHLGQVDVVEQDGSSYDAGPADAIFVNAGATHPCPVWLDGLRPGGRLLVPITVAIDQLGHGGGGMLKVIRDDGGFPARFISQVGIFPCLGARDAELNEKLSGAFRSRAWHEVRLLRRDHHEAAATCWLHGKDFCLSAEAKG